MALTDSVSVFAEGTPEEQVQELVDYVVRGRSDEEREAVIRPFAEAIKAVEGQKPFGEDNDKRRHVFTQLLSEVKGLGDGTDKDIEGFFNLVYSHLLELYALDSPDIKIHLDTLLQVVSSAPTDKASVKYRILSGFFNAIPRTSSLRLPVYTTILDLAAANDELDLLNLSRSDVEKWLSEWDISDVDKANFAKRIADAYTQTGQSQNAFGYTLTYVRLLPASSPEAQPAAISVIADALRLPAVFDFDPLFKLNAVVALRDHELFSLLQFFANGGLVEFHAWVESHPGVIENHNLEKSQLERKIRLLALSTLGFKYIGQDLPYSEIAETLRLDVSQVESWIIDVIRAGLLSGKMSQSSQSLHVVRSTARVFEKEQWEALEKRVLAWRTSLASVMEVVASAKRQAGFVPVPVA